MRLVVKSYFPRAEVMRSYCRYLSVYSCICYFNKFFLSIEVSTYGKSPDTAWEISDLGLLAMRRHGNFLSPAASDALIFIQKLKRNHDANLRVNIRPCHAVTDRYLYFPPTWLMQPVGGGVVLLIEALTSTKILI